MATVFVSPGVYSTEQDFTAFASRIGITKLAVVGKFPKGPAFEAIKISTADENVLRFGGTNYEYPATYITDAFLTQSSELFVSRVLGKDGFTNTPAWLLVADFTANTIPGAKSATTLAVIRSKTNNNGIPYFSAQTDLILGNWPLVSGSPLSSFVLSATTGPLTAETNGLTVSLDETRTDYLAKALGKSPKVIASTQNLYVESIFPHFVREAAARGEIMGIYPKLIYIPNTNVDYADYTDTYTNAKTPWIVSRVIGGTVKNLFKVHTRSDGDASNREIKVSITNIDLNNNLFDIAVRYYDKNDSESFSIIERHSRLSLNPDSTRYIERIIGSVGDEPYPRKSNFIEIEMADSWPIDTVPAGFRGYELRSTSVIGQDGNAVTISPNIYYKTVYFSGDSVPKTYLGVSELGYSALTSSVVGVRYAAQNVEHDIFQYQGATATGKTLTLGYHMESGATIGGEFESGGINSLTGYTNSAGITDRSKLKFTVMPYGGFDGWNKYKTYTYGYEEFAEGELSNIEAYKDAIDVFESDASVDVNLLATSGIDYQNNEELVKYALNMVEERADIFYVIDSPRITAGETKGTADEAVEALELTGIDSTYAGTYWPWIQVADVNTSRYVYMAPTFAVVRSMAFTDNKYQSWFAPAGALRGTMPKNVIRADVRLTKTQRDTLYNGRINPITDSTQNGVLIWGQKTLQVKESALDRINVRRLLLRIERLVAAASITLVFEQNDQTLRDQFLAKVEPILLQIQNQRGITGFKVTMDDSNNTPDTIDRNMLIGKIQIKPTRVAEFIDLTFQILPTGANFEEF